MRLLDWLAHRLPPSRARRAYFRWRARHLTRAVDTIHRRARER